MPEGIKFVDVDLKTGIPEDPTAGNTLRVAVSEEVEFISQVELDQEAFPKKDKKIENKSILIQQNQTMPKAE